MIAKDINNFSTLRTQARAYMCYLFTRNIPNNMPSPNLETITYALTKITKQIQMVDASYLLDKNGIQIIDNIANNPKNIKGNGENRSNRAYFYRAMKERKCILTDPYPCFLSGQLTVTSAYPIFNDDGEIIYIACIDITLTNLLKVVEPTTISTIFTNFSKTLYSIFSVALLAVSLFMFYIGINGLTHLHNSDIKEIFEATILLTLSLAIFDLVKAIFEEEVLGKNPNEHNGQIHKTMIKFLGSIIIALAIEALMLVFKFAITGPEKLVYAVFLIFGVTMLLFGLSFYLKAIATLKDTN
jgi:hypothetical protein